MLPYLSNLGRSSLVKVTLTELFCLLYTAYYKFNVYKVKKRQLIYLVNKLKIS